MESSAGSITDGGEATSESTQTGYSRRDEKVEYLAHKLKIPKHEAETLLDNMEEHTDDE